MDIAHVQELKRKILEAHPKSVKSVTVRLSDSGFVLDIVVKKNARIPITTTTFGSVDRTGVPVNVVEV